MTEHREADMLDALFDDDDGEDFIPDNPFDFVSDAGELEAGEMDEAPAEAEGNGDDNYTPSISEGDFLDPAQRFLFKILKAHIRAATNVNSKASDRTRALEWVFVPGTTDKDGIEFEPCCIALGGRPVVVRARTMHQLWIANILLNDPLPFLAALPPRSVLSEIGAIIGPNLPYDLARAIWYWPSIPAEALREKFNDVSDREYHAAINSLDANGYIGIVFARLYFISRNPTIMTTAMRGRFQFGASIHGE